MINIVHNADCLPAMRKMKDNQFDLAIVDPPYNINKAKWDNWKTDVEYVEFLKTFFLELQRIVKKNGSIYLFHNDFNKLSKIQYMIDNETDLILRQFIVWNKRFDGSKNKGYLDGFVETGGLRNYQKLAEYIVYYTFQDETGLSKIMGNCIYPIRDYMRSEIVKAKGGIKLKTINEILGCATNGGGIASAYLSLDKTCPAMITKKHYLILRKWLNDNREYKYLRREYEDLRYYFNNKKTHHSVWNYDFVSSWHPTPKPIPLIKNILSHSCKPNGKVINPFNGSENIRIACWEMGFDFEGFEIDKDYWQAQEKRFNIVKNQQTLFNK